jgi:predicted aspartyl protease
MVRYAYNRQVTPPAPFVHVTVRPPYEGPVGVVVPAQIDTAADVSVIPGRLIEELQLLPLDSISALGFGGHLVTLPTFLVEIQVKEQDPVTVKVLASHDEPHVLLGRDVLNRFTVLLDGPNLAVELR